MKHTEPKNSKRKNFIKIPTYPGGKDAYLKFVTENIVYPEQALSGKVEGFVHLVYTVNNIGEIADVKVTKGIGSGCDEEAVRVIRMLQYIPARNRGIKMKAEMKTRIHFKLPETIQTENQKSVLLNYASISPEKAKSPEPEPRAVYNYTINLDQ